VWLEACSADEAGVLVGLEVRHPHLPFVRRVAEADLVLDAMAQLGLRRGENGLKVYAMCKIPNNVILIDEFAKRSAEQVDPLINAGVYNDRGISIDDPEARPDRYPRTAMKSVVADLSAYDWDGDMPLGLPLRAPSSTRFMSGV
jgi:hypothetical protein